MLKKILKTLIRRYAAEIVAEDAVQVIPASKDSQYLVIVRSQELCDAIVTAVKGYWDLENAPRLVVAVADEATVIQMSSLKSTKTP